MSDNNQTKPVIVDGFCGDCPYLKPYGKEGDLTAHCEMLDAELDWYDSWLALCTCDPECIKIIKEENNKRR